MILSDLKTNDKNPRIIKDDKFQKLCGSIKRNSSFLALRPIIYNKDMVVVAGNMRYRALMELGYSEIPDEWTRSAENMTEEELREFIVIDNISYGEWDWDILGDQYDWEELTEWGVDVPDFVSAEEIIEDEFDATIQDNPITRSGDIYELNQHRFQCGDSTNADVVNKTLNGARPMLMVTDPPYGVNYDPQWRVDAAKAGHLSYAARSVGKVQSDERIDWSDVYSLFEGDVAYVWHGGRNAAEVQRNLSDCGFEVVSQIIWAKTHLAISRGDYHWQHEPCWYVVRKGKNHNYTGDRKQTTLWEINSRQMDSNLVHGTQKPAQSEVVKRT